MRFSRANGTQLGLLYETLRKKNVDLVFSRSEDGTWTTWYDGSADLTGQHQEHSYHQLHEALQAVAAACGSPFASANAASAVADAVRAVLHETKAECVKFSAHPENESICTLSFYLDLGAYVRHEIVLGDETGPKLLKQLHEYLNQVAIECSKRALEFHRP